MKCGYETYGVPTANSKRRTASQRTNVDKLVALFERTNIFPNRLDVQWQFDDEFFWREVMLPKATGSEADKKKEEVELPPGMEELFKHLCEHEDNRIHFEDFEDEDEMKDADDVCSVVSSCVGSVCGEQMEEEVEEDDNVDAHEDGITVKVDHTLKQLGNVKRKRRSEYLMLDVLGDDGDDAMKDVKKSFEKTRVREKRKLDMVKICCRHFDHKMEKRARLLTIKSRQSKQACYAKKDIQWRKDYEELMRERRFTLVEK